MYPDQLRENTARHRWHFSNRNPRAMCFLLHLRSRVHSRAPRVTRSVAGIRPARN